MQPGIGTIAAVLSCLPLAGTLAAQTRGYARLISQDAEITEGCAQGNGPSARKVTLAPGEPLPIPVPIICGSATLRFTRFRLTLPARTDPGTRTGPDLAFDAPLTLAYDLAAEWTGGAPSTLRAELTAPGPAVCSDALSANVNAQASRVCEWMTMPVADDGFSVVAQFSFAAGPGAPVWQVKSTARYQWTPAPLIERIEFVQAVQSEDQRVPLFAGKPTQIRIFPAGSAGVAAKAQVQVKYAAGEWRYTTPRSINTPSQVNRNSDARSFVIPLPADVSAAPGTISIEAQLITAEGRLLSALARPVTAEFVEAPRAAALGYLQICESAVDGLERVCPDAATGSPQILGAMAEQVLPVAVLPQTALGTAVVPRGADALRRLLRLRRLLEDWPSLAAVLPARGELAGRFAGRWSSSPRLAIASDSADGSLQLADSLAGAYGIAATADATAAGFDLRSGAVVPTGSTAWLSAANIDGLATQLRARGSSSSLPTGEAEFLLISGAVARDGSTGSLGYGFRATRALLPPASDPAARTCLQLSSASGETSRFCFTPEPIDAAATEDAFAVRIPWLPGARQITLLSGDTELAARTLSASPPQAEFLTPLAGNRIPEGPMLVQWSGSDADGDALRYDLWASPDGGATWLPMVSELDRTDFTLDTSLFPTSSRMMLQLRFSDGLQSGAVTTGPFEILGAGGQMRAAASTSLPPMLAGQTSDAIVTVANTGSGTLFLDSAAVSNPGAVQLIAPPFPAQVAPGATLPVRLRVTPPAIGASSATLALDGPTTAARMALTMRGVNARNAQLEHTPGSLDFGTVMLGQTRELAVTIGNGGALPLTVTAGQLPPAFRITGLDAPLTLAPGGQQEISVRFQPVSVGSAFAQLVLESDDPLRRSLAMPLSGYAVAAVIANDPKIDIRPAPFADFGNVRVGAPAQQSFTVRNSGTAPLVITQISASPTDYSVRDFPALPFTLAPNAERIFFVRIDAVATGARLGQLTINSNDPANPAARVGLSAVASLPLSGTVVLTLDDGTFERYAGFPSGDSAFLSRLKPPAYPATLKAIRLYFGEKSLEPGEGFGLLWAAHPTGTEELPTNLRMQSSAATVRNPMEFIEYQVTPMTIDGGEILVGFQTNKPMAAPLDTSTNLMPTRSYASRDGAAWRQSVLWPGFPSGVFAIRAVVDVGPKP